MLKNQLYHIISLINQGSLIKAEIKIMDTHPIFDGHFPDVPVLPGATMMQIAKELLEEVEQKPLMIIKAGQIKFLQMLNPQKVNSVNWEIEIMDRPEGNIKIKARMYDEEITFLKMTALLS